MPGKKRFMRFLSFLRKRPNAQALLFGSENYPDIKGTVRFYQTRYGVLVATEASGLPLPDEPCENRVFALHIHSGNQCSGDMDDPFANAMTHYNPDRCPHPYHAGDLPPLFGNDDYAFQVVLTDRFTVSEIIGKTVIIHSKPDDFTSQPSGNAGAKIACGQIRSCDC